MTKTVRWLIGALFGVALLVTGITATAVDLVSDEDQGKGSAGITLNALDRASQPQEEPRAVAGIALNALDVAPQEESPTVAVRGLSFNGID
jgi:hypothetical protein